MSQFKNLAFEGGGVRGIAYAGALQVLEQNNILPDIRRVAGTSAGESPRPSLRWVLPAAKSSKSSAARIFAPSWMIPSASSAT